VAEFTVRFPEKDQERFTVELIDAGAPAHTANFRRLVKSGFYKGCAFHRAFPDTLVQVGDPLSKKGDRAKVGTGGPGYTVPPEVRRKHVRGSVAAARLPDKVNPGRLSNGSQFYVALKPLPELDGAHTVFGQIRDGIEVLQRISNRTVDSNDYPVDRIIIRKTQLIDVPEPPPSAAPTTAPATKKSNKRGATPTVTPAPTATVPAPVPPAKPLWKRLWPF
jgi:cyclophilin family peptidyl-prolyl cis-trans isomerase